MTLSQGYTHHLYFDIDDEIIAIHMFFFPSFSSDDERKRNTR
jgi:hypothetical protein